MLLYQSYSKPLRSDNKATSWQAALNWQRSANESSFTDYFGDSFICSVFFSRSYVDVQKWHTKTWGVDCFSFGPCLPTCRRLPNGTNRIITLQWSTWLAVRGGFRLFLFLLALESLRGFFTTIFFRRSVTSDCCSFPKEDERSKGDNFGLNACWRLLVTGISNGSLRDTSIKKQAHRYIQTENTPSHCLLSERPESDQRWKKRSLLY